MSPERQSGNMATRPVSPEVLNTWADDIRLRLPDAQVTVYAA